MKSGENNLKSNQYVVTVCIGKNSVYRKTLYIGRYCVYRKTLYIGRQCTQVDTVYIGRHCVHRQTLCEQVETMYIGRYYSIDRHNLCNRQTQSMQQVTAQLVVTMYAIGVYTIYAIGRHNLFIDRFCMYRQTKCTLVDTTQQVDTVYIGRHYLIGRHCVHTFIFVFANQE